METTDRKNRWRRVEASRVREQRIITGYVELKYPDVYKEAANFYNLLNEKYPFKKDLRKTNEYEWLKAEIPGEITKKYYKRRKPYPSIKQKVSVEINNPIDNMQLIIPLIEPPTTSTVQQVEPPPAESNDKVAESQREQADKGETSEIIQDTIIEDTEIIIGPTLNDEIPNDMIEEIINGLRQDPDLNSIFDDMVDIEIDEVSPLEKELMFL